MPTSLPCIHLDPSCRARPQCFFLQSENHAGLQAASFCKFRTPCPIFYSVIYPLSCCFMDISLSSKSSRKSHTGQIFSVSSLAPGMVPVSWTAHQCMWIVGFSSLFYKTYLARNTQKGAQRFAEKICMSKTELQEEGILGNSRIKINVSGIQTQD